MKSSDYAAVLLTDSLLTYSEPRPISGKYHALCSKQPKNVYMPQITLPQRIGTTTTSTTSPTTTTTTSPTTTTTIEITTTSKTTTESIINSAVPEYEEVSTVLMVDLENKIRRSFFGTDKLHRYYLPLADQCATNLPQYIEEFVGYIFTKNTYPKIKHRCPDLKRFGLYSHSRSPLNTLIADEASMKGDNMYQKRGIFYCAPRKGYCGANFELVQINSKPGTYLGDILYPVSNKEISTVLKTFVKYEDRIHKRICWIWRPAPSTHNKRWVDIRNALTKTPSQIYRAHIRLTQAYNMYSLNAADHLVNTRTRGHVLVANVGWYMNDEQRERYKDDCPLLQKMNFWVRDAPGQTRINWFGPGPKFAGHHATVKGTIWCAPYRGYCGADYALRSVSSVPEGIDHGYFGQEHDYDLWPCNKGVWKKIYHVCWIWKPDSYYKEILPSWW